MLSGIFWKKAIVLSVGTHVWFFWKMRLLA
jgi:hypothetical protein